MEKEIDKPSDNISKDEEELKKWFKNPPIYICIRPLHDSGKIASLFYEFILMCWSLIASVYQSSKRIVKILTFIRSKFIN